tara:strand:+ start:591 stop:734 length:144 start_codon:yes stop_codon:yes gene_type:complete
MTQQYKKGEHPYYDSEKKKRNDYYATKVCFWCIVGMILILIIGSIWD